MSYVDSQFYLETYNGTIVPAEVLVSQLQRASDQIDSMTYNRISAVGFDTLTPFQQEQVKKAVCAQADFNFQYGEFVDVPLQGFSAGGISMQFAGERINGVATSRTVKNYLGQTGLADRRLL